MYDRYESPLGLRYASKEMQGIFSQDKKFKTWRKLWIALAQSEKELGLDITQEQIDELIAHKDDINYDVAKEREKIAKNICRKFSRLPNSGYLQIWMQRMTYQMKDGPIYNEPICKIVNNEPDISLWNNTWLKDELVIGFPTYSMRTDWLVKAYTPIIDIDEVSVFDY